MTTKSFFTALSIGLVVIGIGGALFYAQPDEQTSMQSQKPDQSNILSANEYLHDFGTVSMKDGKVKTAFTLTNNHNESATITKLYTSCMCTEATLISNQKSFGPFGMPGHGRSSSFNEPLLPGKTAQVEIEFDPNAHGPAGIGTIKRDVVLESATGKLITLQIKANVTP